jgi:hypothetical protein
MVIATIADKDATASGRQFASRALSRQHASWFSGTAPFGKTVQRSAISPSTKSAASASTQSSRLQNSESVMPISLFLARIS